MEDSIIGREKVKVLRGQVIRSIIYEYIKVLKNSNRRISERRSVNQKLKNCLAMRCDGLRVSRLQQQ